MKEAGSANRLSSEQIGVPHGPGGSKNSIVDGFLR